MSETERDISLWALRQCFWLFCSEAYDGRSYMKVRVSVGYVTVRSPTPFILFFSFSFSTRASYIIFEHIGIILTRGIKRTKNRLLTNSFFLFLRLFHDFSRLLHIVPPQIRILNLNIVFQP